LKGSDALKSSADGIVRIGEGVFFHRDALAPPLPTSAVSGEVDRADTKQQMSLDLDDLE
jgi:hypothetical protein